jgi:hypothetical protein
MSVNIEILREGATDTVLALMLAQFEDADEEAMRQFAATIAEAAVAAVQHMIARAKTELSGEGLL